MKNENLASDWFIIMLLISCTALSVWNLLEHTVIGYVSGGFFALIAITLFFGMVASGKEKRKLKYYSKSESSSGTDNSIQRSRTDFSDN